MEFYLKVNPQAKNYLKTGNELQISIAEKLMWVTVTRIEEDKVFLKVTGENEKYLESLYEKKAKDINTM